MRIRQLGLYQGPGGFSPERGHARDPEAPQIGQEGEQARPGLPAEPGAFAAGTTRLLQPWRSERGGFLRGHRPERLEGDTGSDRLAEGGGTRNKNERTEQPEAQGPTPLVKKRLQRLPQVFDVWQADFRPTPVLDRGKEASRYQPWIVMVTSRTDDLILTQEITGNRPPPALIWDTLAIAMEQPATGDPHRPIELHVRPRTSGGMS